MQAAGACGSAGTPVAEQVPRAPYAIEQYVLEQTTRDRWLNAPQRPELTPFSRVSAISYIGVAPAMAGTGERTIHAVSRSPMRSDSASLTVRSDGRIVRHAASLAPLPAAAFMLPDDSARMMRRRLLVGGRLMLPLARTWEIVPRFHPRRLVAGERWMDTIALSTEYEGARQSITGVRSSVLLGDTVVDGDQMWIVRDSARIEYSERELEHERTLGTLVTIDRVAVGTMRGTYLYDRGLFWARDDTTALDGEAVLQYPDGRTFRTPTRYERTRRFMMFEPDAYAARQAAQRADAQRRSSGPVRSPANETERRLTLGDTTLRDSLMRAWNREPDPDQREQLFRLLSIWGSRSPSFSAELEAMRVAAGDSAFVLRQLAERAYPARPPIEIDEARRMIRVMADPGVPFAFGASRDALYENLVQTLVTWPPALAPASRRPCTPDACRLLGEQWRDAAEPRLRDVGLTALVTTDPVRWSDTVLARAAAGSAVLASAAALVNGVGATWPAAAKLPLPEPGAGWRQWLAWSSAQDPRYRSPPTVRGVENELRFEESHATAIRFSQLRTGRDVIGELRRDLAAATDDSARLVFGAMLNGLGDRPSVDQIAAQLRSGSPPQIALAVRTLPGLFRAGAPRADSATTIAVLDRLIAASVDGVQPWPNLPGSRDSITPPPPRAPTARPPMYVLTDSVPIALRDRWRGRVRFISADEWQRMPEREAATLLTLSSVERVGPFIRVRAQRAGRLSREPNETPRLYVGGEGYYLLAWDGGWVVVAMEMWAS